MAREVRIAILGDSRDFSRAVANADRDASKLHGSFSRVGTGITNLAKGMAIGVAGIGVAGAVLGKGFIDAAIESQKVTKQTAAVIKSMGGVANVTADQVADLSEKLSMQSGVDDELIQSGQNVLLTFGNVRNAVGKGPKIFDRATEAALNMSVALGTDMTSASMMVGKALNDPVKGLAKLARSGVQFSKKQEDQIKTMVLFGKTSEAQTIMLEELERQFGGSAEAQATAGDKLKVVWGNLQEQLGEKLLPVFESVASWLTKALPAAMNIIGPIFSEIAGGISAFVAAFKDGGDEVTSSGLAGFIENMGVHARNFADVAIPAIQGFVTDALEALSGWWNDNGDNVINFFEDVGRILRDNVAPILSTTATIIKDEVLPRLSDFAGWIGENEVRFDTFRTLVLGMAGAWALYSTYTSIAALTTLGAAAPFVALGLLVVGLTVATQALADLFSNQLNTALQWIIDRIPQIVGFFSDVLDLATRALAAVMALKDNLSLGNLTGLGGNLSGQDILAAIEKEHPPGKRALGGPVFAGRSYLVGERGPELLTMGGNGHVTPNNELGGGGVQIQGDIHVHYPSPEPTSDTLLRVTRKAAALAGG